MKRIILSAFFGVLTMFSTPQKAHVKRTAIMGHRNGCVSQL